MLGLLFGWMTYTVMRFQDSDYNLRVLALFAGVVAFYAIAHLVIGKYGTGMHRWYGAIIAVIPVVFIFALGGPPGRVASVAYVGLSFLLQTTRADGGCEVLAVPAAVFRRPTHLAGILFSPIDLVEKHLSGPGGLPG
jgi:hypothetical protein